jgi:hypothetical protein
MACKLPDDICHLAEYIEDPDASSGLRRAFSHQDKRMTGPVRLDARALDGNLPRRRFSSIGNKESFS